MTPLAYVRPPVFAAQAFHPLQANTMPPALYANGQHGMILKERQIDPTRRCDGTEDIMSIFLTILAVVIAVPIGMLIWMAIGVKRSMNRNDNRKE